MVQALVSLIIAVPDPGQGIAPPGSAGLLKMLQWAAYVGLAVSVVGLIATGAQMAVASRRGEGGEHMSKLGWVFGGAIIIGSASALVTAVL